MALSTRIKSQLNGILRPVGFQIGTTTALEAEKARIKRLETNSHWENSRYNQGIRFEPDEYLAFLEETCLPYKKDFLTFPRLANGNDQEFYLENGYFRSVDAEVLYSIIRYRKPEHIVEVGSGFSTRLMARAIRDEHLPTTITSIDPSPRITVSGFVTKHIQSVAENEDPGLLIDSLHKGDVLFIDSSHQIVTGGDVPFLFLEVLPKLRKGVLIHIHDIFFPFDYPREWVLEGWNWNEQYLVHAFLAFNEAFQIVWPSRYMWGFYQSQVTKIIPSELSTFPPSSLWLEKVV